MKSGKWKEGILEYIGGYDYELKINYLLPFLVW